MTSKKELEKLKELIDLSIKKINESIINGSNEYRLYHELELLKDLRDIVKDKRYDEYIEYLKG